MEHKYAGLALAIIVVLNNSASSAVIKSKQIADFCSLPEDTTSLDDNSIKLSRSKRQIALDLSTNADVNPPIIAAPAPESQPATKAPVTTRAPVTTQTSSEIAGVAANAAASGLDTIEQLSQVGDRIGQRLNNRLDKLQTGVDTLVASQVDAITDLFKSGIATGAKIPTTGLKLLVAKLRLPLYVFG